MPALETSTPGSSSWRAASAPCIEDDDAMMGLLQSAVPKPAHIADDVGGAALALALHCLMIREGFSTVLEPGQDRGRCSSFAPPPGWAGRFKDEWVFTYSKDGFASRFILHCSLQSVSKRMLVSVSEELNNVNNEQLLGLQLDNYVPNPAKLRSNTWAGVVVRAPTMCELFQVHLVQPLLQQAEPLPTAVLLSGADHTAEALMSNRTSASSLYGWLSGNHGNGQYHDREAWRRTDYYVLASTAVAVLTVAGGIAILMRSNRRANLHK